LQADEGEAARELPLTDPAVRKKPVPQSAANDFSYSTISHAQQTYAFTRPQPVADQAARPPRKTLPEGNASYVTGFGCCILYFIVWQYLTYHPLFIRVFSNSVCLLRHRH
jgi:hypothetical protein